MQDGDLAIPIVATVALGGAALLAWKLSSSSAPKPVKDEGPSKAQKQAAKAAKRKQNDSKKAAAAAAIPTPAPEEVKPKKKSKPKAKKEPAPAPEPEPEPEPEPVPEPAKPISKKAAKKAAKAEKEAPKAAPEPVAPADDGFAEVVTKKKKGKKSKEDKAPNGAATKAADVVAPEPVKPVVDEWETVAPKKKSGSSKTASKAVVEIVADGSAPSASQKAEITLDLGDSLRAVMGTKGSVISGIQAESGAILNVTKGTTMCKITGSDTAVAAAVAAVKSIMQGEATAKANLHKVVLKVGQRVAPAVIGKGGSIIRKIQTDSGAKVDVDCDEGTVTISGDKEAVEAAKQMVHVAIHGEAQEIIDLGKTGKFLVIGKEGATIRRLQAETGAKFDIDKNNDTQLKISGSKEAVTAASEAVRQLLADNSFVVDVLVPDSKIGAVVGKGGSVIRSIQDSTGARLETEKKEEYMSVQLTIRGTKEQVAAAKDAVDKCLSGEPTLKDGEICKTIELGSATGAVIGAGGKNVVEIEKATGSKLSIVRGTSTCRIFGGEAEVAAAVARIEAIVAEAASKQAEREAKDIAKAAAKPAEDKAAATNGWDVPSAGGEDDAW